MYGKVDAPHPPFDSAGEISRASVPPPSEISSMSQSRRDLGVRRVTEVFGREIRTFGRGRVKVSTAALFTTDALPPAELKTKTRKKKKRRRCTVR